MQRTELHQAFSWDCDNCGREQFARTVTPELSDEEHEELKADFGLESWQDGDFVMMPTHVTCKDCNTQYETQVHTNEDESP